MPYSDHPQFDPQPQMDTAPGVGKSDGFITEPLIPSTLPPLPSSPPPVENPVWNGWDVMLLAVLTFVVMVVLQLGLAIVAQRLWYPHDALFDVLQKVGQRPTLVILSQFLIYIPVAILMVALIEGKYHVPFWRTIRWNWPRSEWKFLTVGGILLLLLTTLENLMPMPKNTPFDHLFDRPLDAYLLAFIAITFAPLMEELFFRGFLYPVLARRTGLVWGILLSALPFGLVHLPQYGYAWSAALVVFLVGVVCGVVRAVTHSVAASFLVHVGYNGTQMLIAVLWTRGFTHMPKSLVQLW